MAKEGSSNGSENKTGITIAIITSVTSVLVAIVSGFFGLRSVQMQQYAEATKAAVEIIATQGGETQISMENTASVPTQPPPTYTPQLTYTPYPTFTPQPTFTIPPTPDALFRDDFSSNQIPWNLSGSSRLSDGKLKISIDGGEAVWLTIPNFKIEATNYYIQADIMLEGDGNCWQGIGFALGEKDVSFHKFLLLNECDGFGFLHSYIGFYDNGQELFRTELTKEKKDIRKLHTLRLEVRNGLYTLLVDGVATDSQQIPPHGNDIGVFAWNYDRAGIRVYSFDNILVREIP